MFGNAQRAAKTPSVNGFFRGREQLVSGWALDLKDLSRKRIVEVFVGGKSVGFARADRFDPLVQSHHGGDGHFAFAFYYDGSGLSDQPVEAGAIDTESGTPLRSKQPLVSRSPGSGPPLTIEKVTLSESVLISGKVGAYPIWKETSLEIWAGDKRIVSDVPMAWVSRSGGLFTAEVRGAGIEQILSGDVEIALPGLKESGHAVPLRAEAFAATVTQRGDELRIELKGGFEVADAVPVIVRFTHPDRPSTDIQCRLSSGVASMAAPADIPLSSGSVVVLVAGTALPTRFHHEFLSDAHFDRLGEEDGPWRASENSSVERSFFAFPAQIAEEHDLSGDLAHVSRTSSEGALRLYQVISDVPGPGRPLIVAALVRGAKRAKLTVRLRDDEGVLCAQSATSRNEQSWAVLRLDCEPRRQITGNLVFEVESSPRRGDFLEVALSHSRRKRAAPSGPITHNLVTNDRFEEWPRGTGVLQHSNTGEICAGWRLYNRNCNGLVWTRAVMDPTENSMGLAIAAPDIPDVLRVEADLNDEELGSGPLVVRFRAGVPHAARQLLAQRKEAIPEFMQINRVAIVRRLRVTGADHFEERDDILCDVARRVPVAWNVERFSFMVPSLTDREIALDHSGDVEESHHLVFEFRQPAVLALFDVEVLAAGSDDERTDEPELRLEDRNIVLQIPALQGLAHWQSPTPVFASSSKEPQSRPALKWSLEVSQEPVEIVVPVFNALQETLDCLESLGRSSTVPILVRLIDDGSEEPVRSALEDYARDKPWISLHSFGSNRGYTYAADFGIRSAKTKWVVLLNSDTIVTRGWLEGLLACARSDPSIALVGPLSNAASYQSVPEIYDARGKWKMNRLPAGLSPDDMAEIVRRVSLKAYPEVPLLNGFCTMIRKADFIELGGLNYGAFPAGYGEENDLCLRARKSGLTLAVADDVYVYHVKSASFGGTRRSELTKEGNEAFRKLHPEVDIASLTKGLRHNPALAAVRAGVARELAQLGGSSSDEGRSAKDLGDGAEPAAVEQSHSEQV